MFAAVQNKLLPKTAQSPALNNMSALMHMCACVCSKMCCVNCQLCPTDIHVIVCSVVVVLECVLTEEAMSVVPVKKTTLT